MPGFISEDILEEIQTRTDIVEVISHYIPLKKAGGNFNALCPFHNEQTPSFIVSPSKQIFHCFGCGAGGNIFGFIMQYEHLDFVEAVKLLAERAGIVIPDNKEIREKHPSKGLWDINKFAGEWFHKWLLDTKNGGLAYKYLKEREIKEDTIKTFHLGYAPAGNLLIKKAKEHKISASLLKESGLAVETKNGLQDMFRNRLMFPIYNVTGKIAGFSGRVLNRGQEPKYLNSPETQIFHKAKILFGLNISKSDIIKQKTAVLCEGHFDLIRLYQEGIRYAAAVQGTALTPEQLYLIRRYTEEIVICFDGDTAGVKAAMAKLDMFLQEGFHIRVVNLPKEHDPDSFIKVKGIAAMARLITDAKDILEVKFSRLCKEYAPLETIDNKVKIIAQLLPNISKMRNDIRRRQFIKDIAVKLNIAEDSLWIELKKLKAPAAKNGEKHKTKLNINSSELTGEKYLLQLLLDDTPLPEEIGKELDFRELQDPQYRELIKLVTNLKNSGKWKGLTSLMQYVKDNSLQKLISQLSVEAIPSANKENAIKDCIYNIRYRYKKTKIRKLIKQVEAIENSGKQDITGLMQEINKAQKDMVQLEKMHNLSSNQIIPIA